MDEYGPVDAAGRVVPRRMSRYVLYPSRVAALAQFLHQAAQIPPDARILDVGHGCGDSLLLLAETYKPACLHGVTFEAAHAQQARQRLGERATIWCADAVEWLKNSVDTYDTVLALDCAYHFSDRADFVRTASQRLAPGGTLALVDLVGAWPYPAWLTPAPNVPAPSGRPTLWERVQHYVICRLSRANPHAFISFDAYRALLHEAHLDVVDVRDISHDVFPGFAAFLQGLGVHDRAWRGGSVWQRWALRAFGSVVQKWAHGGDTGHVRCSLWVARKGSGAKHMNVVSCRTHDSALAAVDDGAVHAHGPS